MVLFMGKIKRGNYIFLSWIGDHGNHVHVYHNKKLILKWDLDENKAMVGTPSKRVLKIIVELQKEGLL